MNLAELSHLLVTSISTNQAMPLSRYQILNHSEEISTNLKQTCLQAPEVTVTN